MVLGESYLEREGGTKEKGTGREQRRVQREGRRGGGRLLISLDNGKINEML